MRCVRVSCAAALLLLACGPTPSDEPELGSGDGGTVAADAGPDAIPFSDAAPAPTIAAVYAHTANALYTVDPDTLEVTLIANFSVADGITDIALDKDGNMIGVSFTNVYAIDKDTAACSLRAALSRTFNGLSFVPAQTVDATGDEILIGAASDGSVWQIDPMTGLSTNIGSYGSGYTSSGDIVSVQGFGTVATVKQGGVGGDILVRLDPNSGFAATAVGSTTGYSDLWGLGFWKNEVYAFSASGQFVLVDVTTGLGSPVDSAPVGWWGAGVTTSAPIID